jgi:hypothetical protein
LLLHTILFQALILWPQWPAPEIAAIRDTEAESMAGVLQHGKTTSQKNKIL